jgi:tellurite resistance protein TerC
MTVLGLAEGTGSLMPWAYAIFIVVVLVLLALDLGVFHRKAHEPSMREALGWTAVWVALALAFAWVVHAAYDHHWAGLGLAVPIVGSPGETMVVTGAAATKLYLTAYLVEKSLSMDNVFVIAMIFSSLAVPVAYQHRVLFWGILGALVMRGVMISVGAAVVAEFAWIVYVFGGLLIVSAIKMGLAGDQLKDWRGSRLVGAIGRVIPVRWEFQGQRLIGRFDGKRCATPLLVALVIVEATDVLFAVDSIPAVFAITGDPFLVFTSNIMAILGLRSLYFCLASAVSKFHHLKTALIAVLLFVGIKMCLVHTPWKVPAEISMAVVIGLLISGITASVLTRRETVETPPEEGILRHPPVRGAPSPTVRAMVLAVWRSNRTLRRVVVLSVGSAVLITGLVISPLPGPGLTILGPVGIGILASEFLWARRVAVHVMKRERSVRAVVDRMFAGISRLLIVPAVALFWGSAWLLSEHTPLPSWVVWSLAVPIVTPMCYVVYRWHRVRAAKRRGITKPGPDVARPAHAKSSDAA